MIDWSVKGESWGNCNCDHWCPCQFEGLPTHYECTGYEVFRISEGHFGDVDLSGVKAAVFYAWPGPIFKGGGVTQAVIDPSASPQQRAAISSIIKGEETEEGTSHWWVFHTMSDTVLDDLFIPIELDMDIEKRTAHARIAGILDGKGEPIRNPVDGAPHRVQIRCPEGIEFEVADIGNASSDVTGDVSMTLRNSYGQWNKFDQNNYGPAHNR